MVNSSSGNVYAVPDTGASMPRLHVVPPAEPAEDGALQTMEIGPLSFHDKIPVKRNHAEAGVRVERGQQGDGDAGLLRGAHVRHRHLAFLCVGLALGRAVQVVELRHRGVAIAQQLAVELRGDGVPKDDVLAFMWFNIAAARGDAQAALALVWHDSRWKGEEGEGA